MARCHGVSGYVVVEGVDDCGPSAVPGREMPMLRVMCHRFMSFIRLILRCFRNA